MKKAGKLDIKEDHQEEGVCTWNNYYAHQGENTAERQGKTSQTTSASHPKERDHNQMECQRDTNGHDGSHAIARNSTTLKMINIFKKIVNYLSRVMSDK